ncbi:MAG: response regulator [Anaerolineae bacterium]|nr:response regulator [Anaerolineae bacterium]
MGEAPEKTPEKSAKPEALYTVLVVEDTVEMAEVIQVTLERMNLKVFHETHGNQALKVFRDEKPDMIILDIGLPDTSGWQVLETIREEQPNINNPVILVMTAYGDPANRLMGKLQGIYGYLIKPLTPDRIEKEVAKALNLPRKK